jgi:hypothetical protein
MTDRRDNVAESCYCCGSREHRANDCPTRRTVTGNTNVTNGNEGSGGGSVNNTTSGSSTSTQGGSAAPGAVQMLLDGAEQGAYDDAYEYANLFVTIDDKDESPFQVGTSETTDNTEYGFTFLNPRGTLPRDWILLDNQSTVNVFCNKDLLVDIRTTDRTMVIRCNAGVAETNQIGHLPGCAGEVWYYPNGIVNILSFADVAKHYRVTYDNKAKDVFQVHRPYGTTRDFFKSARGLYYMVATPAVKTATTLMIDTVAKKKELYTDRAIKRAELARQLQNTIGHPPLRRFLELIDQRLIPNCPVTREDVLIAEQIFGTNLAGLKGRTTRKSSPETDDINVMSVPPEILAAHGAVTLAIDLMYVNKIPFLVSISKSIKFGTVSHLQNKSVATINDAIERVCDLYAARKFRVVLIKADPEFEPCRPYLTSTGITLNVTAEDEHVPEVERYIRTVERTKPCCLQCSPFPTSPGTSRRRNCHVTSVLAERFSSS